MDKCFETDYSKMSKVYTFTDEEIKKLEMKPSDIWREKLYFIWNRVVQVKSCGKRDFMRNQRILRYVKHIV